MKRIQPKPHHQNRCQPRRGAALVEFAVMAPLFIILILGTIEIGAALRGSQTLYQAVRGGARLATMDFEKEIPDGMTANGKVTADIMNFMRAAGMDADAATVSITGIENGGSVFDLEDPDNQHKLFRVEAEIPYSAISTFPNRIFGGQSLRAAIVMRAGRATLSD